MSRDSQRRKPTGKTGPLSFGPDGQARHLVEFPQAKLDIEMFIARLFCAGKAGMRPQVTRYGALSNLTPQRENSVDLKVDTERGARWLELTESRLLLSSAATTRTCRAIGLPNNCPHSFFT
jgi:hypothetical protein